MNDLVLTVIILVAWYFINRVLLPKMGVNT